MLFLFFNGMYCEAGEGKHANMPSLRIAAIILSITTKKCLKGKSAEKANGEGITGPEWYGVKLAEGRGTQGCIGEGSSYVVDLVLENIGH